MLMVGDFIFALSMYPVHLGLDWWQRLFTGKSDGFVTVQESTSSEYSSEADISDAPSSLLESSADVASSAPPQSRRKATSRRSTGERTARDLTEDPVSAVGDGLLHGAAEKQIGTSNFLEPSRQSGSPSRRNGKAHAGNPDPETELDLPAPLNDTMPQHQIWHPPPNSSDDDDDFMRDAILKQQQQELDEWRQYPAFPSAYPPTPLAVTATLVTTSLTTYPPIEEEQYHQDFRPSLLPPRRPLNPSHAADTSDANFTTLGNSPSILDAGSVSSDISDDEDQSNITLQTPLPVTRTLRSQSHVPRPVSILSELSVASVGSRASALTTSDVGSPLQTQESVSDSSSSASKPVQSIPIIGKKRAFPRNDSFVASNRVRQIEEEPHETSGDDSAPITAALNTHNKKSSIRGVARYGGAVAIAITDGENGDLLSTSSNDGIKENIRHPAAPEEKRRKVIRASAAVNAERPATIRTRVGRQLGAQRPQSQKGSFLEAPAAAPKRLAVRARAGASNPQQKRRVDGTATIVPRSGAPSRMVPTSGNASEKK